jgi:BlaI family transcriptional regulator, penicillinase repressor
MEPRELPKPTAGELEILGVLWEIGPATVRQVHTALEARRPNGYTTVLKLMQIMTEKGLLEREEEARAHVYKPTVTKEETQGQIVNDLVEKVFSGSAAQLVQRALSRTKASKEELKEIRRMIAEYEGGAK